VVVILSVIFSITASAKSYNVSSPISEIAATIQLYPSEVEVSEALLIVKSIKALAPFPEDTIDLVGVPPILANEMPNPSIFY